MHCQNNRWTLMADVMTPEQRSRCMSRIRSANTKPELALRRLLFASGMRFRTRLKLPGKPDVAFTRAKLAVFIDGCFWHGCPQHGTSPRSNTGYWNAKLQRNRERDTEVGTLLAADGWEVIRYWEHEIKDDLDRVGPGNTCEMGSSSKSKVHDAPSRRLKRNQQALEICVTAVCATLA